jgi:hypothetical protein
LNGIYDIYVTGIGGKVDWATSLRKLPFSVVQVLMRLDVDAKWKDLAAQLGSFTEELILFAFSNITMKKHEDIKL